MASLLRVASALALLMGLASATEVWAQLDDASIGDRVWLDQDADGIQDAGETGVPGVIVYLDLDDNGIRHPHEPFATTDTEGAYDFTNLAAGTYVVRIDRKTIPSGYELTTGNLPLTVVLSESQDFNEADFGYDDDPENASIGDYVWHDQNGDGVQDVSESGLSGVTVFLDLNGSAALDPGEPFATSGADGTYNITGLAAGTYSVLVDPTTVPSGYELTTGNLPLTVVLAESQDFSDADFGYDDDPEDASIGDFVWLDQNGDGIQDAGESGISGITVFLDLNSSATPDPGEPSATTDISGTYDITGLAAGTYSVRVDAATVPAGYNLTTANLPLEVMLGESQHYNDADFGYGGEPEDASIGDYVWLDQDADGVQDAGEDGIPDVIVYLDLDEDDTLDGDEPSDVTDALGAYDITGLGAGTYSVRIVAASVPTDYGLTTTNLPLTVVLSESQDFNEADFGYDDDPENASIGDYVWHDQNGDGVQDVSESGLSGVTVFLDLNGSAALDPGEPFATSGPDGTYNIAGLAAGTYSVLVDPTTVPSGYELTTANLPLAVVLAESQDLSDADFGYDAELGFMVSPDSLFIAEPAGTATFTVSLTSQPADTVTIGLSASNSECTVDPTSLALTPSNWQIGSIATVTALDDPLADGSQTCIIQTAPAISTDTSYNGQDPDDVTVIVADDDAGGINVSASTLNVSEPDGTATFTVTLTSRPISSVFFPVDVSNDQCSASQSHVRIAPDEWESGQAVQVNAVDDDIDDGTQTCLVQTGTTLSDDAHYDGLEPDDVTVYVQDDDIAGIDVSPTILTVSEPSGFSTFDITLTSQPESNVLIPLSATSGECSVTPTSVSLTASDWDIGVTATVYAVDDDFQDGSQPCTIETEQAQSADLNYDQLNPEDVDVTVLDNDIAGIQVTPTELAISEPDGSDVFTIALNTQPTAQVFIELSVSNDECSISPDTIMLDAANWSIGVVITVTAVNDDLDDDLQTCLVQTGLTSSDDADYDGLMPQDVIVEVDDDDTVYFSYLAVLMNGWPPTPGIPALNPIDNADGDGTYTISWTAAAHAESYVLQEATNSNFSDAAVIYAGPSTNHAVSGHGAARYYYRVRAQNSWGDSDWSNVRQVDVLWEAEPNATPNQANGPIVPNLVYYGTFPNSDDVDDYFFFDLSAPRRVEIWLSNIPSGHNYNLVLRNAALAVIGYSAQPGNTAEHIKTTGDLPPGRYYIQVYHYSSGGSMQPYHLKYSLE